MSVSIQNLSKVYGTQKAIDNLNFEVAKGEVLGFLGPNGAGKTTTMKIITSYLPPTEGTVSLGEFNIHDHPLEIKRRVGYLPEHNPLYLDMYVHEFLEFAARVYKLPKAARKTRIPEVIEMTGLGREQHKKIGMLSKGYRQRVGLSQALIHDPEVLILDEPTSGLDPNQIVEIRNLIREVGKDKTVIFSSHILSEVESIADRVIIIDRGKIVADSGSHGLDSIVKGSTWIEVEFEAPGFDFSAFEEKEEVEKISQISPLFFKVHTHQDVDLRKEIFEASVSQGHILLTLRKETLNLEDAFRKLTHLDR